jgi:hypothetical protein
MPDDKMPIDVQRFEDGSFQVGPRYGAKSSACSTLRAAKAALTRWKKRYPDSPVNGEELLAHSS